MAGPLSGYRIIELAGIGPGPFAAMMLADMGAEVVRVERANAVHGPAPDTPHFDVLLRGRRNIAIDLKQPEGVVALLDLVASADGLIEGFRPGVMERLGIGPDVCAERNPRAGVICTSPCEVRGASACWARLPRHKLTGNGPHPSAC